MYRTPNAELVRTYSIEVGKCLTPEVPPNDLRRVLVDGNRQLMDDESKILQWRKYYEPWEPVEGESDPATRALQEKSVELSHAWKTFRRTLPENERDKVEETIPSVETLIGMVEETTKAFETKKAKLKRGKFMKYFTRFCGTLDAHSSMLEALPNDRYLCLFTGTLKTIINASSNYEKMAKGIGEALSRISKNVVACKKEVDLYKTEELQKMIANLYAHIFLYLQDTMEWYMKKSRNRLLDSFNDSFKDHFEEIIVSIENISSGILREVGLGAMAEIRQIKFTTDLLATGQANLSEAIDNIDRKADLFRLEIERRRIEDQQLALYSPEQLEQMKKQLFFSVFNGVRDGLIALAEKPHNISRMLDRVNPAPAFIEGQWGVYVQANSYRRGDLLVNSSRLKDMYDIFRVSAQCDSSMPLTIATSASSHVMEWTTARKSSVLSIAGQKRSGHELAPMTVLASVCIDFAEKSELPVISYFCELSRDNPRPENTRESHELIGLTYSLMRQLIERLPPIFDSEHDFSDKKLSLLDGTLKSWDIAIGLLRDLIQLAQTPLFCIIDGFQELDDRSTERFLDEFVKVLREPPQPTSNILKVLFTTTGRSRCLLGLLSHDELVLADQDGAKNSPARRAGNSRFSFGL